MRHYMWRFYCFYWKTQHIMRHYMLRFITDLSAVINTEWVEKKIKTVPHSAKSISIIDIMETRTILRTISEQLSKT